jgi:DNA-binding CsgD family transcriptional regulator
MQILKRNDDNDKELFMLCYVADRMISIRATHAFESKYKMKTINTIKKRFNEKFQFQADMDDVIEIYDSMYDICKRTVPKMTHSNFAAHWFYVLQLRIWGFMKNKSQNKIKLTAEELAYMKQFNLSAFELSEFTPRNDATPEAILIHKEDTSTQNAKLAKGLATLTLKEQEIFELRRAGVSFKDIAIQLDMKEGAVKTASHRLMEKLKGVVDS